MYEELIPRFLRYAKMNTRSDETSTTTPSTQSQVEFAQMMVKELNELGLNQVEYNSENGFVTATLPGNTNDSDTPVIGFISHMDTADFNADNIQPQIHENYDGSDIVLNKDEHIVLSPKDFPNLKNYIGETLITTDGLTLLGSDDKSGIAEIMSALTYFVENPDILHGDVRVAFGPDEEIGIGADKFDVPHFSADFAYTVDGGPVGELQYESFNAAGVSVKIRGKNVHPGTAKDTMVNALQLAVDFHSALPIDEVPEHTEGREGFYHLVSLNGNVEDAEITYIIRDHDKELFKKRKENIKNIASKLNERFAEERVSLEMNDQYYNMREIIEKDMRPVELAEQAMKEVGIKADIEPIRGGTDGSKISFMGLPTPNLFAGGENFHGRYEFVSVDAMEKATDVIIKIIQLAVKK